MDRVNTPCTFPINMRSTVVRVKLNEIGIHTLQQRHKATRELVKAQADKDIGSFKLVTDEQGYSRFTLWDIYTIFRNDIMPGRDLPFADEAVVEVKAEVLA